MKDAIVYLKTGEKKFGVLLSQETDEQDHYEFISNSNLGLFSETQSPNFIEVVQSQQIEAIELDLK
jgi:hypothetical protein